MAVFSYGGVDFGLTRWTGTGFYIVTIPIKKFSSNLGPVDVKHDDFSPRKPVVIRPFIF